MTKQEFDFVALWFFQDGMNKSRATDVLEAYKYSVDDFLSVHYNMVDGEPKFYGELFDDD